MTLEEKYLTALGTLENIYIEMTKGSKCHQILRNDIQEYVSYLEQENQQLKEQLKQKEDIIDKARKYVKENSIYFAIKDKIGNYFANCNCDELLEILNNTGDENDG